MNGPNDKHIRYSAEQLNAFVDDQLAPDDKSQMLLALNGDDALSREICELRKVHDLVRLAYPEPATSTHRDERKHKRFNLPAIAASLATLALGMIFGWFIHTPSSGPASGVPVSGADNSISLAQPASSLAVAANPKGLPSRIIMHVVESDPKQLTQILDDLDGMLRLYKAQNQRVRVEVVANGEGLALLRRDTTPHAGRIADLQKQYDNLSFVACQNTIDRLAKEKGIIARLLPGVIVIDSGVAQLMRRQNQGWAYIQV